MELKEEDQKAKKTKPMTFKEAAKLGLTIGASKGLNIGEEFSNIIYKFKQKYWKWKYDRKKK